MVNDSLFTLNKIQWKEKNKIKQTPLWKKYLPTLNFINIKLKIFKNNGIKNMIGETMSLDEQKEKLSVKIDEKKVKHEKRKEQAKINHEERKLKLKAKYTDKKIEAHIEKAIKKIYKADDDAEKDIVKLLDAVNSEIEDTEKPVELIVYKAENKFAEILLNTELKMQKAKNELIKNLEKDVEKVAKLVTIEEDLSVLKDEMDEVSTLLDERIDIEKENLNIKTKE